VLREASACYVRHSARQLRFQPRSCVIDRGGSCLSQHGVDQSPLMCMGSMQSVLVGGTPGQLWEAQQQEAASITAAHQHTDTAARGVHASARVRWQRTDVCPRTKQIANLQSPQQLRFTDPLGRFVSAAGTFTLCSGAALLRDACCKIGRVVPLSLFHANEQTLLLAEMAVGVLVAIGDCGKRRVRGRRSACCSR
jgi:hypothetical protein